MTKPKQPKRRRRRGVILTAQGLDKLQEAKVQAEYQENHGYRYTLEALSERTGLAVDTLMKVFACEMGVDKHTLKACFKSFNLILEPADFFLPDPEADPELETVGKRPIATSFSANSQKSSATPGSETSSQPLYGTSSVPQSNPNQSQPELPEGQVPLNSNFYIERPPIESECYKAILTSGSLIRIKAPRRMGKTSLMMRILAFAAQQGYHTVSLSLQLADNSLLQNLDKFLQWFCANVTLGLQVPNKLADYWDELFGSKISCKIYFEEYLLAHINQPIILALDDVDRLFQYTDLADDFFGLLRAWHEEAKNREIWQKLRLIVAHSTEVYIPLNVNQSPFNVGLPVELPPLNPEQILNLATLHQLNWSIEEVEKLFSFVGGNPYLVRLALYHIWHDDTSLAELLMISPMSDANIYKNHLTRQLWNLQQQNTGLVEAFAKVVMSPQPIELELIEAFQLQSLGLVRFHGLGNTVSASCQLYTQYFQAYFAEKMHN